MGKWVHTAGEWHAEGAADVAKGMQASEDMRFHAISAPLDSARLPALARTPRRSSRCVSSRFWMYETPMPGI